MSTRYFIKGRPGSPEYLVRITSANGEYDAVDFYGEDRGYAVRSTHPESGCDHLKTIRADPGFGALILFVFAQESASDTVSTGTVAETAQGFYQHMGFTIPDEVVERIGSRYDSLASNPQTAAGVGNDREYYVRSYLRGADWFVSKDVLISRSGASASRSGWTELDVFNSQGEIMADIVAARDSARAGYDLILNEMRKDQVPAEKVEGVGSLLAAIGSDVARFRDLKSDLDMYFSFIADLEGVPLLKNLTASLGLEVDSIGEFRDKLVGGAG